MDSLCGFGFCPFGKTDWPKIMLRHTPFLLWGAGFSSAHNPPRAKKGRIGSGQR
jgi:hypothetical protein